MYKITLLLFFTYLILGISHPLNLICAPNDEFKCNDGKCILIERHCDNIDDCSHGEDENECHYLHNCESGMFMCQNGECQPSHSRCNGNRDCSDGSDELGCQIIMKDSYKYQKPKYRPTFPLFHPILFLCDSNKEYQCPEGKCFPIEHRCDNIPDCKNGVDEDNCHYLHNCEFGLFMCLSGECLTSEVRCNGVKNCYDDSDEFGCPNSRTSIISSISSPSKESGDVAKSAENCFILGQNIWFYLFLLLLSTVVFGFF